MFSTYKKPICPHFPMCSGCQLDLSVTYPPIWSDGENYFAKYNLNNIPLYYGPMQGWRCRAKLAVRGTYQNPLIGLFREGTHEVISIPFCKVHHPQINFVVDHLREWIQKNQISIYDEKTHSGDLRYLQCVVERHSSLVQTTFVLNIKNSEIEKIAKWKERLKTLYSLLPGIFQSLWINLNDQPTNTIFAKDWLLCEGEAFLWENFGNVRVCYQPASFAQANLDLFEKMLFRLKSLLIDNAQLIDFYSGVGVIGLFLAQNCESVVCAEINPHAALCFHESQKVLAISEQKKIRFETGSVNHLLELLQEANVLVVDPPRKGLEASLLKVLQKQNHLKQLLYVSCGWESFKRDCDYLCTHGWELKNAEGYFFFPGTNHIEIVADFRRKLN